MDTREILLDPNINLAATLSKAKTIGERATKKGLSGGFEITTETRMEISPITNTAYECTYLIVKGTPAVYNGWTFLARIEWINNQPIVNTMGNNQGTELDGRQFAEGECDHCGIQRQRNSVIIVENENGDRMQVGKSCAKDYLGHDLPLSWFAKNEDMWAQFGGYEGSGSRCDSLYRVMLAATTIVRQRGYVYSGHPDEASTRDLVKIYIGDEPASTWEAHLYKELHKGFDADKDHATTKEAFDFAVNMEGTSNYVQNVQAVLSVGIDGHVAAKHIGLVVSIASVYEKELIKRATTKLEINNKEFGKVGDKITLTIQTINSHSFDTMYGISYINTFASDGYRFKWFTGTQSFEDNQTINIKGTIKAHEEYNGQISTILTRCKVVD